MQNTPKKLQRLALIAIAIFALLLVSLACDTLLGESDGETREDKDEETAGDDDEQTSRDDEDQSTPACALICNFEPGFAIEYEFEISCESGQFDATMDDTTSFFTDSNGYISSITVDVDQELVYESSGNTYRIVGSINLDESSNTISDDISVTGGEFGDTPQTCDS